MLIEVQQHEVVQTNYDLALSEAESAKSARRLAEVAQGECALLIEHNEFELARAWHEAMRALGAAALGHWHAAARLAPNSRPAAEARRHADVVLAHVQSFEDAMRRD